MVSRARRVLEGEEGAGYAAGIGGVRMVKGDGFCGKGANRGGLPDLAEEMRDWSADMRHFLR